MRTKIETNKQVHRAGLLIFVFIYKFEKYLIWYIKSLIETSQRKSTKSCSQRVKQPHRENTKKYCPIV
jgi:hypothetical protein